MAERRKRPANPRARARAPPARAAPDVQYIANIIGRGKQGRALARALVRKGVRTRADLRKPGVLRTLPKDSQMNVMYPRPPLIRLAEADELVDELTRRMVFCPTNTTDACFRLPIYVVGSIRRRTPRVKDVDLLVHLPGRLVPYADRILDSARLTDSTPRDRAMIMDTYLKGEHHRGMVVRWATVGDSPPRPRYYHVDLFLTVGDALPFALFHRTGSKVYNIRTRAYAKRKGWLLNQYGIYSVATGKKVRGAEGIRTEKDLAEFLGVSYREPNNRER